jgi:hypothetical protein
LLQVSNLHTNPDTQVKTLKYKLLATAILIFLSTLVISGFRLRSIIYPLFWIGIPVFIYSIIPKKESGLKAVLIVCSSIFYILTGIGFLASLLCGSQQGQYRYIHKTNKNLKLIGRDYSCYGTTEDMVLYKEFSISKDIKLETHYKTFVDYKNINIDTTVWQRVDP